MVELAHFAGPRLGQLVFHREQIVGDFMHDFGALERADAPPFFLRRVPRVDRGVDLGRAGFGNFGDDILGRRIDNLQGLAGFAAAKLAVE